MVNRYRIDGPLSRLRRNRQNRRSGSFRFTGLRTCANLPARAIPFRGSGDTIPGDDHDPAPAACGASRSVSATLAALLAGLLGVPAGTAARGLARRHGRWPLLARPPLLESVTGLLWALLALRVWPSHPAALPAYLALGLACVALVAIDLGSRLLPDRITYPSLGLIAALLLVASLVEHDPGRMVRALEAAGVAGGILLALTFISPDGMGIGDAKFALLLGLPLGWLGWSAVVAGFLSAFLLGGLAALIALSLLGATLKTQLPFGPWLALGALLAVLAAASTPPT
jgi:leader peptidase (prepilin peptidase)/N-methyltransferase